MEISVVDSSGEDKATQTTLKCMDLLGQWELWTTDVEKGEGGRGHMQKMKSDAPFSSSS